MIFFKGIKNTYSLLIDTLQVVQKDDRFRFLKLIIFLVIQSLLDVITIASIVPLLYIFEGKDKLENYILLINENFKFLNINLDIQQLYIYIPLIVISIMLISTVSRLFIVFKTNQFIEEIRFSISSNLMNNYINNNFNKQNTSEVAKSILSEVDQFIIIVFQPTILMLTNIFLLISLLIYIFYANFKASLLSFTILALFYLLFYLFSKNILNMEGIKSENANKGRFKTGIESFESIKDIKIYSAEKFFSNRFKKHSKNFAITNSTYNSLVASPKYLLEMIVFIILSSSVLYLATKNKIDINSLPLLGTFAFAAYKAQPALSNVIYGINSLEYGSKIINNLNKQLFKDSPNNININKLNFLKEFNNNNICLDIRNVTYKYEQDEGINNINLKIEFPSLFILVGESGSGKSTLLNLISGLLRPQTGKIYFNKFLFKNFMPKISYLHQDYSLFDATIAENIAFGEKRKNIDYVNLEYSLKQAGIYNYVSTLKNNIFEKVGENGSKLSIGQKQRIALARAIYYKPDLLLLDEPTSSLDEENQQLLIKSILEISKNITVIMSTHKLNFLPNHLKVGYLNKNGNIELKTVKEIKTIY